MTRALIIKSILAILILFAVGHAFVHHGHDDLGFHHGCYHCALFLFAFAVTTVFFFFAVIPSVGRFTITYVVSPEYISESDKRFPYHRWYQSPLFCRPPPVNR